MLNKILNFLILNIQSIDELELSIGFESSFEIDLLLLHFDQKKGMDISFHEKQSLFSQHQEFA